jgi:hypothetical protein
VLSSPGAVAGTGLQRPRPVHRAMVTTRTNAFPSLCSAADEEGVTAKLTDILFAKLLEEDAR